MVTCLCVSSGCARRPRSWLKCRMPRGSSCRGCFTTRRASSLSFRTCRCRETGHVESDIWVVVTIYDPFTFIHLSLRAKHYCNTMIRLRHRPSWEMAASQPLLAPQSSPPQAPHASRLCDSAPRNMSVDAQSVPRSIGSALRDLRCSIQRASCPSHSSCHSRASWASTHTPHSRHSVPPRRPSVSGMPLC